VPRGIVGDDTQRKWKDNRATSAILRSQFGREMRGARCSVVRSYTSNAQPRDDDRQEKFRHKVNS
jgi:hypothetical protein